MYIVVFFIIMQKNYNCRTVKLTSKYLFQWIKLYYTDNIDYINKNANLIFDGITY